MVREACWSMVVVALVGCTDGGRDPTSVNISITAKQQKGDPSIDLPPSLLVEALVQDRGSAFSDEGEIHIAFRGETFTLRPNNYDYLPSFAVNLELVTPLVDEEPVSLAIDMLGASATIASALPTGFTISQPAPAPGPSDPVHVTWAPTSDDAMSWSSDDCAGTYRDEGPIRGDPGMIEFPPGVLAPSACRVTLRLSRTRTTAVVSPFNNVELATTRFEEGDVTITP